ncbi:hypothetical protein LPB79_13035 [Rhizobium sp. T136]|uniref:hypothetical protein n=1 Tax=Rhizobium TaxID=379 RepID=UPI00055E32CE|nr:MULTISPECIES: hypothetical protein [Rhizobium]UFS83171.1 hypothetical protein LPB79_13035 [Rhizobium sp. T136]
MRDICHLRDHRECDCTGTCQQVVAIPAPYIHAVWKDFAMFFGAAIVITVATFWAVSEAERQFAIQDRINQEQVSSWKK